MPGGREDGAQASTSRLTPSPAGPTVPSAGRAHLRAVPWASLSRSLGAGCRVGSSTRATALPRPGLCDVL